MSLGLEVRVPKQHVEDGYTFVARFHSTVTGLQKSVRVVPGNDRSLCDDPQFDFVDTKTIVYLQKISPDGTVSEISPRVRLGVLDGLRLFPVEKLYKSSAEGDAWKGQAKVVFQTAQWITTESARNRIQAMAAAFARLRVPQGARARGILLDEMLKLLNASRDDCALVDVLVYAKLLLDLKLSQHRVGSYRVHGHLSQEYSAELERIRRVGMSFPFMPLTSSLCVGISDALGQRGEASAIANRVRARFDISQNSAETGVFTFGEIKNDFPSLGVQFYDLVGTTAAVGSKQTTILYSGNPEFYRAYLGRIFYFMTVFEEYHYHFSLLGPRKEANEFVDEMLQLWNAMASIKRQASRNRLSVSFAEVPENLPNRVSFLASARYLFAAQNIEKFPKGLWIHDIDLYPDGDFRPIIGRIPKTADIAISLSPFLGGILPWKRFLAGNVYLRSTPKTQRFLSCVQEYLDYWLQADGSWMIDQNALAYGAEKTVGLEYFDLLASHIPMRQSSMASLLEGTVGH
ncbi:hypothetical protein [Corynebacterium sp. HMSC055A01]|uniref:hypothetical protein n=1 Tax=Corynebacterium sp. HMSC055A01 TaxID=1715083 RepID=UPI00114CCF03|nr:hypothetical protein [Corynebacterium sp. HMSC055A01]